MTATKIIVALALLVSATSIGLTQSQQNYGPNGPAKADCYGSPYSGAAGSKCGGRHR